MAPKATTNPSGLNDQQFAFCEIYRVQKDKNATQAYKDAYPNCKSPTAARVGSTRLLAKPSVLKYLLECSGKVQAKTDLTAERVLEEMRRVALSDVGQFYNDDGTAKPLNEMTPEARSAIASYDVDADGGVKIKLWSKDAELGHLGKHFKLINDRTELSDPDAGPIDIKTPDEKINAILFAMGLAQKQKEKEGPDA